MSVKHTIDQIAVVRDDSCRSRSAPWRTLNRPEQAVADSLLPPSRFGAGYTAGGPTPSGAQLPTANASGTPSATTYPDVTAQSSNLMASVSFALAVFCGLFAVPLTIPLAIVARGQIKRRGGGNGGFADAALIVSLIYLAIGAVVLVLYVFTG
jgi:hypothetical protein